MNTMPVTPSEKAKKFCKEQIKTSSAYEQFKLQWMIDHGYSLTDLMECMEIMLHEDAISGVHRSLPELFAAWEFGVGFTDGSVWPTFEEYLLSAKSAK